ncbi:MAG TPA: hypothetical protein DCM87_11920 [Planctomycetes bacterium]|nr:hypothetical protein [Planctomycetota bacterium]
MVCRSVLVLAFIVPCIAPAQLDEVEGPWGTYHGGTASTSSTEAIPYYMGTGPIEAAWELDVRAAGHDRVGGRSPITFDSDGNLYWKTSIGTADGTVRIVSVSPEGEIRWNGSDDAGDVDSLGLWFDGTAVVVGRELVYTLGSEEDVASPLKVVAYRKTDGGLAWERELPDAIPGAAAAGQMADLLTPVLYRGKLYVVAPNIDSGSPGVYNTTLPQLVFQLNAADGELDWYTLLDGIMLRMGGALTLVPDAFGAGEHGLYCNGSSASAADGVPDVYGIKVMSDGAELAWAVEGGKVARSHVIYAEATGLLYTHTWADYGGTLYAFDPATGATTVNTNNLNPDSSPTGHGFYDVGCVDFSGSDIIAGGFEGIVVRYSDQGDGTTTAEAAFDDDSAGFNWWGEYRVFGQLVRAPGGNSVLITGTNSRSDIDPTYSARVVAIDVTAGELLWEFASGSFQDHGYTVRGGPYMGPDGKVYYFRVADGVLVALKGPDVSPPTASFTAVPLSGKAPLAVAFDASASTDDGTIVSYAWEFGDGQTGTGVQTTHTYETEGIFTAKLTVTDDTGLPAAASAVITVEKAGAEFTRGDANTDGKRDIADAIKVLSYLFGGGTSPLACLEAGDANDDGKVDIADAIRILGHLFAQTGPLPDPFDACGVDPTPGDPPLGCETFEPCGTGV